MQMTRTYRDLMADVIAHWEGRECDYGITPETQLIKPKWQQLVAIDRVDDDYCDWWAFFTGDRSDDNSPETYGDRLLRLIEDKFREDNEGTMDEDELGECAFEK